MDKNEYNLRLEEINRCVDERKFEQAAQIADQIDWRRVRNIRTLCMISEVYEAVDRPEDSKQLLLRAYRRTPVGRSILYRLVEVTIKLKQFDEAIEYYSEYAHVAPHDINGLILKYKIYRGRGSSLQEQIDILQEYLKQEYNEKYAYELAKLYQEADQIQNALAQCDDLVLWFQSGHYVMKALELKKRYAPLTAKQQEILDMEIEREKAEAEEKRIAEERARQEQEEQKNASVEELLGQEKSIVDMESLSEADNIMEDTAKEIAQAVKETFSPHTETSESAAPAADEGSIEATRTFDLNEIRQARSSAASTATQVLPNLDAIEKKQQPEETQETGVSEESLEEKAAPVAEGNVENPEEEPAEAKVQTEEQSEIKVEEQAEAPAEKRVDYNPDTLHSDILRSMKEITSGVGIRDTQDPNEALVDEVIAQARSAQEKEETSGNRLMDHIRRNNPLKRHAQQKAEAPQLSIDDVLLSMGEKGAAMRRTLEEEETVKAVPGGVLSAVDEALLNFDRNEEKAPAADAEVETETVVTDQGEEGIDLDIVRELTALEHPEFVQETAEEAERTEEAEETAEETEEVEEAEETAEETEEVEEAEETAEETEEVEEAEETVEETEEVEEAEETAEETEEVEEAEETAGETEEVEEAEETAGETEEAEEAEEVEEAEETAGETEEVEEAEETAEETEEAEEAEETEEAEKDQDVHERTARDIFKANTKRMPTEEVRRELDSARSARQKAMQKAQAQQEDNTLSVGTRGFFRGFLDVPDMEMQIKHALEQSLAKGDDKTSRMGNILILGDHGSGKTQLAVAMAKALAKEQGKEFVKMAKIYSTDLNRKDIAATIARIAGGVLIIEEAGDLSDSTADQLTTAMEFRTDGLIVIMEDEERYLHELLSRHPRLAMKFTAQVYIPDYTVDDLIGFAEQMAQQHDCTLSAAAADVLAYRIEGMTEKGDVVNLLNLRELVEAAVNRSGKLGRKLFAGKKRYDGQGRVILLEKDFK